MQILDREVHPFSFNEPAIEPETAGSKPAGLKLRRLTETHSMPPHSQLDIPSLLQRIPLFSELSNADIQLVARYTRDRHVTRGEMLFQRGDQPHGFYFVVSGQVKLAFSSSQGTEKVVEIIGPMQSFGEAVMFMNHPYPVFAEALTDTVLVHVGQQVVTDLIDQDSTFAHKLLAGMAIRLHGLIQDVETYSLRSSTQRVIGYLLQVADSDAPGEIALPTSKQVIASRLNLTPETLSRIFHDLSDAGLISLQGKRLTLHDPARLSRYSA
jgi:CRP-like cAMP-binding protein